MTAPEYPPIPRWRFYWGCGFTVLFKSKRSEWNNIQFCYRPYPWSYKLRRFGVGWIPGWMTWQGMLVIDLGRNRCISIHLTAPWSKARKATP